MQPFSLLLFLAFCVSGLTSTAGPRLDQLQVIGTHNSYHVAPHPSLDALIRSRDPAQADGLAYSHRPLTEQLERLGIRQVELDVYADPQGGLFAEPAGIRLATARGLPPPPRPDPEVMRQPGMKLLHAPDFDYQTTALTFQAALTEIERWSAAHPAHVPILVLVELKDSAAGPEYTQPVRWDAALLQALEAEILEVFPVERVLRPDDVRGPQPTLRQAVQGRGWPALATVRGRVVFALDNRDAVRDLYLSGNTTLAGRLLFVSVDEHHPAAAWFNVGDPVAEFGRIQDLVRQGFMVRTRADAGTLEARRGDSARWEKAAASGAQWISTDYPEPNLSLGAYRVAWPGGQVARRNPVSAPGVSEALDLESLAPPGLEPFDPAERHHLNARAFGFHFERRLKEASADYWRLLELDPPRRPDATQRRRMLDLVPALRTLSSEPFRLEAVVALHHPARPLVAYHLFWDDDIDFPEDNDPTDHEVVWVQYEPVSGRAMRVQSYFHGRILSVDMPRDRPEVAVEWGKHGSLPCDATGRPVEPPGLRDHWRRLNAQGIRLPDHPLARDWPKRFEGDWPAFLQFNRRVEPRNLLEGSGHLWVSEWGNAVLDIHALPYNFAPKREWPE